MSTEIERRFLLNGLPDDLPEGTPIRQGYIAIDGDVEVRVRDRGGAAVITVKGGRGRERVEVERPIDAEQFEALWVLSEGRRIAKRRSVVPVDGHEAEVDVFGDALDGLMLVEVEFASSEAADAFTPPAWFGEEVSGRPEWNNAALAVEGRPGAP